jgi:Trk K+ transport system NAD-binding subunit
MIVPRGMTKFEVGDEVLVITDPDGAEQLVGLFTHHHS